MKRLAAVLILAALALLVPQVRGNPVAASPDSIHQCPPPPAVVAAFLAFTEEQAEQFGTLLNQFQTTLRALQEQIAARQQQLDGFLSQPDSDPAAVGKLVVQIHALQQQVGQAIKSFQSAFAGLLTQEQRQKLQEITLASQLQPVVGGFVALYLVPPPPSLPCPKP